MARLRMDPCGRRPASARSASYDGVMPAKIDAAEVRRLILHEDATLIDVLPEDDYAQEHITGARNVPLRSLRAESVADLDRDQPVIVYCHDDT
jgi:rhodanese-related sulfurtransferase